MARDRFRQRNIAVNSICCSLECHGRSWSMNCGYGAYVDLMKRYPLVTDAFLQLKPGYRKACLRS